MKLSPETETVEYKKTTGELKEGCIFICAMLNKHGVGTFSGQTVTESTLRDVSRSVYEAVKPQIFPTVEKIQLDEKDVVRVEVNGEEKPYSAFGKYYIRTTELLSVEPKTAARLLVKATEMGILNAKGANKNRVYLIDDAVL